MRQPAAYGYLAHLEKHLGQDIDNMFSVRGMYPRQLNIYLPGDHKRGCNFNCFHCSGRLSTPHLAHWEEAGIELINNLRGKVPYHIYSGANTEPLLNPYLSEFLVATKRWGSCFGVKTNGSRLLELQKEGSFLGFLCDIADSEEDFFSISLDAGSSQSHSKTKGVSPDFFRRIIAGMQTLGSVRGNRKFPALRVSYLLSSYNDSEAEIWSAIEYTKSAGFDSIRFSQPHPAYGANSADADRHWKKIETDDARYKKLFSRLSSDQKPFVFYASPCRSGAIKQCAYGYYQMTLSHDGYLYRCTTVALFPEMKLAPITPDIGSFKDALFRNQDPGFEPEECFKIGAYCCRAAIAVNNYLVEP